MSNTEGNSSRDERVNELITSHMMWCVGGGLIPIPVIDMLVVGGIQMNMIKRICKEYGQDYNEHDTKALVSTMTTQGISKIGARTMAKLIPGIGSIVGGVTLGILSGASTYALGEVFKKHFNEGGTILDFDPSIVKKYYDEKFEKGKKMAEEIRKNERTKTDEEVAPEIEPFMEVAIEEGESNVEVEATPVIEENKDIISKLTELANLKENKHITDKEFKKLKKELLS